MRIVHTACMPTRLSRENIPLWRKSVYDLTCGIRMLYVDDSRCGIDIFPNRKDASEAPSTYGIDVGDGLLLISLPSRLESISLLSSASWMQTI